MQSLTEKPPLLGVYELDPGQYIFRVQDVRMRDLVSGVAKLLPDLRTIVLVTPADVKVIPVSNGNGNHSQAEVVEMPLDPDAPPMTDEQLESAEAEMNDIVPEAVAPEARKPRRRKEYESVSGTLENCARCAGTGIIQVIAGNQASDTTCPICSGKGGIKRYGNRR